MNAAHTQRNEAETITVQNQKPYEHTITYDFLKSKSTIRFSSKEIKHLALGALMVIAVAISYVSLSGIFTDLSDMNKATLTTVAATILVISFFTHEIAHKTIAQKHRLWAEFRLNLLGSVLTLISAVPLVFFKIISPGAVMVAGYPTTDEMGKISIAGPITNIALSTAFLSGSVILAGAIPTEYLIILAFSGYFNAWIAIFNLIPLGILDGFKIFLWDKKIWAVAFTASVLLLIFSFRYI